MRAPRVEAHVIHPTSILVNRDPRRPKTDRLDTALLTRAFLGWLRGEAVSLRHGRRPHAQDRKRPNREQGERAHSN